jgi:hypothetical protein
MEGSSGNVVLWCEGCGERTTLGDPLSVWRSGRTFFECGCGTQLTLSDRLDPTEATEQTEISFVASYR